MLQSPSYLPQPMPYQDWANDGYGWVILFAVLIFLAVAGFLALHPAVRKRF